VRQVLTVFRLLEVISNFEDEACRRFGCRFAGRVLQALLRHCAVETRVGWPYLSAKLITGYHFSRSLQQEG